MASVASPPTTSPRETLPSIRTLFADQNLFMNDMLVRATQARQNDLSQQINTSGIGSAIQSLDISTFNRDEMHSELAKLRLGRSASISSSGTSDEDEEESSTPPPVRTTRRGGAGRRPPGPTRVTKKRTQDAKSKESQKMRNRKGRQCENAGFRLLEAVALALASSCAAGNRQIVSNQQKSGLLYTKCSILEMATRLLLVCKPLLAKVREADPELARGLEGAVDQIMLEQGRRVDVL